MKEIQKPLAGEYVPYASAYIALVPDDGLVLHYLQDDLQVVKDLIRSQSEEKLSIPCAQGEWTIKEILVHVSDTERIFAYRALRFARNDTTALSGFEQDDYVAASDANERGIEDILDELSAVRAASIALFNSLKAETFERSGLSSGHNWSVRAFLYATVGHARHHVNSIKENYLEA